jgi:DNA processing protein
MAVTSESGQESERLARIALSHLEPHRRLAAAIKAYGAVEVVRSLKQGQGDPRDVARSAARWAHVDAPRLLDAVRTSGGDFLIPGELRWPSSLDDLPAESRPFGLWVRGAVELRLALLQSVAVVGSRASTPYGERISLSWSGELAHRGWTIVSGGAVGIDAAAHRGALAVEGTTIAVLACGIDVSYPRSHDSLFASIIEHGLLVSEVPPGEPPARFRFLERNRLIAALTRGTLVVEASLRSGALSTAARARSMGRVVMGVPGPVTSGASSGVHEALRDGAQLVTSVDDVLELVGPLDADREPRHGASDPRDDLDAPTRDVLDSFPSRQARSLQQVVSRTGLDAVRTLSALGRLESLGLIQSGDGVWRLSEAGRRSTAR